MRLFLVSQRRIFLWKKHLKGLKSYGEDMIFNKFSITLFAHISVYYIYYYAYLYLPILSICTIYVSIKTFRNVKIKKSYNRKNIYISVFHRIFELVGYIDRLSTVISTFVTQPKASYQRIKAVRFLGEQPCKN